MPDSLQQTLVALTATALAPLPLSQARWSGRVIGRLSSWTRARIVRTTRRNLECCSILEFPEGPICPARRSLEETAALWMEMGLVWRAPVDRALARVTRIRGRALLESALEAGRGVLVLSPHLGNWELLNLWLASRAPLTALYEPLRDPGLDAWVRQARQRAGAQLVPTDASGLRALLRALRTGGMAAILPDQVPTRGAGRDASFFGRPALTMTLVQRLLRSTGAEPLMATALRVPDGFELHFDRPVVGLDDPDPRRAAQALNASVEQCIALAPAQYQWSYKRFKHPPPGSADPYA